MRAARGGNLLLPGEEKGRFVPPEVFGHVPAATQGGIIAQPQWTCILWFILHVALLGGAASPERARALGSCALHECFSPHDPA